MKTFEMTVFGKVFEVQFLPDSHSDFLDADAIVSGSVIKVNETLAPHAVWHAIIHELWHIVFPQDEEKAVNAHAIIFAEALWPNIGLLLKEIV